MGVKKKKVEEKVTEANSGEKENPAKTRACEDSGESSATLTKPDAGDGGNKSLANDEGSQKPPLRKTAINPFLLKKSPPADVKEEPKEIQEKNDKDKT